MHRLISLLLLFSLITPTLGSQTRYYRGNSHTHTYPQSDADTGFTPQKAVDVYKARGYDFIVVTEHVAWWNAAVYSSPQLLVINGEEVGISGFGRWGHFTALNIKSRVTGKNCTHQRTVDTIRMVGAVPFLNHPRYSAIPITAFQVIDSMKNNLNHMEIYNSVTVGQAGPDDISVWDSVLSTGRLMYGVAADDAHREAHVGKGWIMVRASVLHPDTITQAVERGDFYATTGVVLDSIVYTPEFVYVRSSNGTRIQFIGKNRTVLATIDSSEGRYSIKGDEVYVRAEISNSSSQKAWIQPMVLHKPSGANDFLDEDKTARSFALLNNYPNPFNPTTTIRYRLDQADRVHIAIFDLLGREVKSLVDDYQQEGIHELKLNAGDLSSGVYLCSLFAGNQRLSQKLIVMK